MPSCHEKTLLAGRKLLYAAGTVKLLRDRVGGVVTSHGPSTEPGPLEHKVLTIARLVRLTSDVARYRRRPPF